MNPLIFALITILFFSVFHNLIVKTLATKFKIVLWTVFLIKALLATTTGHFDIYRFIVFIQNYTSSAATNPWDYSLINHDADFPYPPFLLYIHASLFFLFKPFLNANPPYLPTALGYTLIHVPLLVSDLIILKIFVKKFEDTKNWSAFCFYLFSPVILFHQYYSGQLDLIAVLPFFIAVVALEKNHLAKAIGFFITSLILKPFGLIFYPLLILVKFQPNRERFKLLFLLILTILFFKISELPFYFTNSYQKLVGAGAKALTSKTNFPILCATIFALIYKDSKSENPRWSIAEAIVAIMLAMAATTKYSAGWMTWVVPFAALSIFSNKQTIKTPLWNMWNIFFVLHWSLVANSPLLDSFSVLTDKFLGNNFNFQMGEPYHWISDNYGDSLAKKLAELSENIFSLISLIILTRMLFLIHLPNWYKNQLSNLTKNLIHEANKTSPKHN
jgi:hypothetical protein